MCTQYHLVGVPGEREEGIPCKKKINFYFHILKNRHSSVCLTVNMPQINNQTANKAASISCLYFYSSLENQKRRNYAFLSGHYPVLQMKKKKRSFLNNSSCYNHLHNSRSSYTRHQTQSRRLLESMNPVYHIIWLQNSKTRLTFPRIIKFCYVAYSNHSHQMNSRKVLYI